MKNIAIFASGTGTNAGKIIEYYKDSTDLSVSLIVCNKAGSGVLTLAHDCGIHSLMVDRVSFFSKDSILKELSDQKIDLIVLAGFLWMVPESIIHAYPGKIINIHPALLPKYGGKGMYGPKVHQAVIDGKEKQSGISIHFVNEHYDEGQIILQAVCTVEERDDVFSLSKKIQALEHRHFPAAIRFLLQP